MNMSEIQSIETRLPIGLQLEINQIERDRMVANAKKERSQYITASFRKLALAVLGMARQARTEAGYDVPAARTPQ